jgi:TonB family protein
MRSISPLIIILAAFFCRGMRDDNPPPSDPPPRPASEEQNTGIAAGNSEMQSSEPEADAGSLPMVSGGVLNGKATALPTPQYPPAARAVKATGAVTVQVTINEKGHVASASAVSGHPLLRAAAENAARQAVFGPQLLSGRPVRVSGVLIYNFVP